MISEDIHLITVIGYPVDEQPDQLFHPSFGKFPSLSVLVLAEMDKLCITNIWRGRGKTKGKIGKIQERKTPKYDARDNSDLMPMYLPGSHQFLLFLGQMRTVKHHHDGEQLERETEYEYWEKEKRWVQRKLATESLWQETAWSPSQALKENVHLFQKEQGGSRGKENFEAVIHNNVSRCTVARKSREVWWQPIRCQKLLDLVGRMQLLGHGARKLRKEWIEVGYHVLVALQDLFSETC